MSKHPNQATLALHAGGDLGPFRRWLTARHLAHCTACREEVAGYNEMRELLPELAQLPEISWNRMAAEIKANIRLGLEAGECVRTAETPLRRPASMAGWRAAVAFASVIVLVGGCMVLERPVPVRAAEARSRDPRPQPPKQAPPRPRQALRTPSRPRSGRFRSRRG